MDFIGQVDGRMLDALEGAKKIKLDIDAGDRTITMDAHFEEMIDIGAMVIARTNADVVMIIARNGDAEERVIQFFPKSGEWEIKSDGWVDTRIVEITFGIDNPTRKTLWERINKYDLKFRNDGGSSWTFTGTHTNVSNFIRDEFERFPAMVDEYIDKMELVNY